MPPQLEDSGAVAWSYPEECVAVCAQPGCPEIVPVGRCAQHARKPFATAQRASNLYGSARWKRERKAHLEREPYCTCGGIAIVVDHDPPHRGDPIAFFDRSRYRSLCVRCANAKTGREVADRMRLRRGVGQNSSAPVPTSAQPTLIFGRTELEIAQANRSEIARARARTVGSDGAQGEAIRGE